MLFSRVIRSVVGMEAGMMPGPIADNQAVTNKEKPLWGKTFKQF